VINFAGHALDRAVFRQPVHKFHRAVMADEHPRGQFADGGLYAVGQTFDRQEKLVLLWLDSAGARLVFAEPEKPADLKSKFRQRLKLADGQRFCSRRHKYIVSRY